MYLVSETFYSLQGEGANAGRAAYFVRLAGCEAGCVWCDSKRGGGASFSATAQELLEKVTASGARTVVITGGEPLLQNLNELTRALRKIDVEVWLETSGAGVWTGEFDWVCLSPKEHHPPHEESYGRADELKVVITDESDFEWATACAARVRPECALYLQPEWSRRESVVPMLVEYIKAHPEWALSLQTHKYIAIP